MPAPRAPLKPGGAGRAALLSWLDAREPRSSPCSSSRPPRSARDRRRRRAPERRSGAGARAAPPETGNLLVLLDQQGARAAGAQVTIDAAVARIGGRPAGRSVPEIGLITVRPPAGESLATFAAVLRRVPGVATVEPEHRYVPRSVPDDPALTAADPSNGIPWQWYLAKEGFYGAWNVSHGTGALVAVIDTGIDGTHPDLRPRIASALDQQAASDDTGPAETDQVGHGTNVASLACADTDNDLGMAGAGYGCRMVIEKTDFSDSSIAASIVDATNRHVDAINMSFGPSVPTSAPAPASEVRALRYAAAHRVVLVAAAADSPGTEQGDPANVLQPAGTGRDIAKGLGLDVTAAQYDGTRSPFAGSGSEISLAAYGAFRPGQSSSVPCTGTPGRDLRGLSRQPDPARAPAGLSLPGRVRGRRPLRDDRGYLDGGAPGGCRGGDDARAQPLRHAGRHPAHAQAHGQPPAPRRLGPEPRLGHPRRRRGPRGDPPGRPAPADFAAAVPRP